ncbi:hypothetical protein C2G38_2221366 [Gigaspora rosea]|uniref:Uncharacterized protein n=1 Tax=Gigaspora rosea TaxID=44941 RepID=A0A397U577_9GLOM|nr:hypothetical protein C2G38_2221366 [Gigaspora rosea]
MRRRNRKRKTLDTLREKYNNNRRNNRRSPRRNGKNKGEENSRIISQEEKEKFGRKFKETYLSRENKLKIGLITSDLKSPFHNDKDQKKHIELQHKIIKKLYTHIWIPSRQTEKKNDKPRGIPITKLECKEKKKAKKELYYRRWVTEFVKNNLKASQLDSVVQ